MKIKTKNIILYSLVVTSLAITNYLFSQSPAHNSEQEHLLCPAKANSKALYELTSPTLMISHNNDKSSLLLPKSKSIHYKILKLIANTKISNPSQLQLSTELRQRLFNKSNSIELQYANGCPLPILAITIDNFSLNNPSVNLNIKIDSIWIELRHNKVYLLLISTTRKKVIQFETDLTVADVQKIFNKTKTEGSLEVEPLTEPPSENNFNQLYLPKHTFTIDTLMCSWDKIDISQLISNMFFEPALEPLQFSDHTKDDLFYIFNEHSLYHNNRTQTITYRDTSEAPENNESTKDTAMEIVNRFINQHYGWKKNKYALETITGDKKDESYSFRLIKKGFSVYRDENMAENIMLDTIQIDLSKNHIIKYIRPSQVLTDAPDNSVERKTISPSSIKEITRQQLKKTPLKACFFAYLATNTDDSKILLEPVWIMITTDNERIIKRLF